MEFKIKEARESAGYSQKELAELIGVAPNTFHGYESGKHDPKSDLLIKIAHACHVTTDFLLGTSATYKSVRDMSLSESEKGHIKKYRSLDAYGKEAVDSILDIESARCAAQPEPEQPVPEGITNTIIYADPAVAGSPLYAESNFERVSFPSSQVPKGTDFGIRIAGDSMEPTIHDGSIAWVHKKTDLEDGDIGIFMINDSAVCKRFFHNEDGSIRLESDNPVRGPVVPCEGDTVILVGKVIGTISGEGM